MIFTKVFHLIEIGWSKLEQVISYGADKLKLELMLTFKLNWTLMSWPITPQNTSDLNQGVLHLCSQFSDPGLNMSQVLVWTGSGLTHRITEGEMDTRTYGGNDNTCRPKLYLGKNVQISKNIGYAIT